MISARQTWRESNRFQYQCIYAIDPNRRLTRSFSLSISLSLYALTLLFPIFSPNSHSSSLSLSTLYTPPPPPPHPHSSTSFSLFILLSHFSPSFSLDSHSSPLSFALVILSFAFNLCHIYHILVWMDTERKVEDRERRRVWVERDKGRSVSKDRVWLECG